MTPEIEIEIRELREVAINNGEHFIYEKLAKSICPEIYGMENVKKALLL